MGELKSNLRNPFPSHLGRLKRMSIPVKVTVTGSVTVPDGVDQKHLSVS